MAKNDKLATKSFLNNNILNKCNIENPDGLDTLYITLLNKCLFLDVI